MGWPAEAFSDEVQVTAGLGFADATVASASSAAMTPAKTVQRFGDNGFPCSVVQSLSVLQMAYDAIGTGDTVEIES